MSASLNAPHLSRSKYKNWIKAGLGVLYTKEVIEPFACDEIKQFQHKCLSDICINNGIPSGTVCSSCCTDNVVACPTNRICNVGSGICKFHQTSAKQYLSTGCPNKICHNFKTEIQKAHRYNRPSYKNTDAKQWCSNPWEVAKCFMPPDGYNDVTSAAETDFNGIISVIINFKAFQLKVKDDISKDGNIFEQGRKVGKALRHCPNLEMEDKDLQQYFTDLQNLLSDPVYLSTAAQGAKTKLLQLQNDTLIIGKDDISNVLDGVAKTVQAKVITEAEKKRLELIHITKQFVNDIEGKGKLSIDQLDIALKSAFDKLENETQESLKKVQAEANTAEKKIKECVEEEAKKFAVKVASWAKQIKELTDEGARNLEGKAGSGVKQIEELTDKGARKLEIETEAGATMIFAKTDEALKKIEKPTTEDDGYKSLSRTRSERTGNFIDSRNAALGNSMHDLQKLVACYSSVCQIRFGNKSATGFRVGSKYIMTAFQVVNAIVRAFDPRNQLKDDTSKVALLENRNVCCIFDYLKENHFRNVKKYYFEPVIHFKDEATDTAVLELKHNSYFNQMPPALDQFGFPEYTGKFTLIGHEGSLMKVDTVDIIIDKESPTTIEDIRAVKAYNNRHTQENYEFEPHGTLTNENRILFHCKFSKGASGSPGLVVLEDGSVVVVTMLLCGYPNWYYNEHVDRQVRMQWPKEYCIEQGADLSSVGRIMSSKAPDLYQDIFCSRSVPEAFL